MHKIKSERERAQNHSLVNCDNKTNHCNRYVSNGLFSDQNGSRRSKLSNDDENSHPINASNTNNKSERKRNINMLLAEEEERERKDNMNAVNCSVGCDDDDGGDYTKRIKVDSDGQDNNKSKMYQIYQPWVLKTYGDQSKSKTITLKKQSRIVSTLKGLESNRPDSSKFRFWVRSKAFLTELPLEFKSIKQNQIINDGCLLFIPCKSDSRNISFKRVAVVEYFFNIIYKVHCSVDEGEGRHVGQKRTYRKITECYAFLPREAVTKFLTQCHDCRRSMKSTIVQEIAEKKTDKFDDDAPTSNNKNSNENIENYYALLRAICESSAMQSCERKSCESFKENVEGNRICNGSRKNININIKNEADNSEADIIINSLDVSINGSYGNINKVRISCTTPTKAISVSSSPSHSNQQIVTSSSSSLALCDDNFCDTKAARALTPCYGVAGKKFESIPDDIAVALLDYRSNKPTCNNNFPKHTNSEEDDDAIDYHAKGIGYNKRNSTSDIKPITSTYLLMTRSMGLTDEDALNLDSISSQQSENHEATLNTDESYANLLKDADKLKLMLLAWNYQNSAALRSNGNSSADLNSVSSLWEQYQNALGLNVAKNNGEGAVSPSPSQSQDDANSPSDNNKEEDEASEDESDERIDQASRDPERLKAFNMFVRLFVDENLDRMIPISKQPKEKVQAIIDSCARQFPDFSERARKRLRTYLKSCRRNKKIKDGWENQPSRPTPAHLTSVQAEQILAMACENESMNAKRMRLGLEPISQPLTIPLSHSSSETQGVTYTTVKQTAVMDPTIPLSISTNIANCKTSPIISTTTDSNANSINSLLTASRVVPTTSAAFDFSQAFSQKNNLTSPFYSNAMMNTNAPQGPTDLSIKRPLLPHNLNVTEAVAVKQLITGYREAAAFLLRSADELEQLLLSQPSS